MAQGSLAQPKLSSAVLTGHSIKTTHSCWFYASWQHTGLEYRLQHSEEGRHTSGSRSGSTTIKSASAQAWSAASGSMLGITFPSTASSSKRRMWQIVYLSITQISHVIPIGPCFPPGRCHQQTQCGECGLSKQVTVPCLCMCTLQKSAERWPDQIKCVAISQLQ